jgi:hypothetical protein
VGLAKQVLKSIWTAPENGFESGHNKVTDRLSNTRAVGCHALLIMIKILWFSYFKSTVEQENYSRILRRVVTQRRSCIARIRRRDLTVRQLSENIDRCKCPSGSLSHPEFIGHCFPD